MRQVFKILRLFFLKSASKKMLIMGILLIHIKVKLITYFVPTHKYFHKYFSVTEGNDIDFQSLRNEYVILKSIKKYIPWNVSCLLDSMVIQEYFKKYGLAIPIFIGVATKNSFRAHAWTSFEINHTFEAINDYER